MCGIVGRVNFKSSLEGSKTLEMMLDSIKHRGPDDSGIYRDSNAEIGMARLEILDPLGGRQPMNSNNRFHLVFNGQIYNHLELRTKVKDYAWKSHSDTETLLVLLEKFGELCIPWLAGMFAFALWDSVEKSLLLARDKHGEKPLFYCGDISDFRFASTCDSLLQSADVSKEIDSSQLMHMLKFGYVQPNKSIYENISNLPPGFLLKLSNIGQTSKSYISYESTVSLSNGDAVVLLEKVLTDVVESEIVADVPVGIFLSGGVDSSVLAAILSKVKKSNIFSFTLAMPGFNDEDIKFSKEISEQFNLEHHEIVISQSDIYPLFLEANLGFDEPFGDSASIPLLALSKFAKKYVGVSLSGDGADEYLGGYDGVYRPCTVPARIAKYSEVPDILLRAAGITTRLFGVNTTNRDIQDIRTYKRYGLGSQGFIERIYETRSSTQKLKNSYSNFNFRSDIGSGASYLKIAMQIDQLNYLLGDIVVKSDRASMAASLELRAPYLHPLMTSLSEAISDELKMEWIGSKKALRQVFQNVTGREFPSRGKLGLGGPVTQWLQIPEIDLAFKKLMTSHAKDPLLAKLMGSDLHSFSLKANQEKWNLFSYLQWRETRGLRIA